jgi:hypothetical protein
MKRSPLKRHARLAPGRGPRRVVRVKAVNAARKRREFARAYGSAERVAWVKTLVCAVAGRGLDGCFGPIDVAHVGNGGAGRKADAASTVPMCRGHHCEQHQYGVRRFEAKYRVDLAAHAAVVERAWRTVADEYRRAS